MAVKRPLAVTKKPPIYLCHHIAKNTKERVICVDYRIASTIVVNCRCTVNL